MVSIRPLKLTLSATTATLVFLCATQAFALDGYRQRKGLFYGGAVGFGVGQLDAPDAPDQDGEVGLNLRGRVGGGVTDVFTLDGEMGLMEQFDVERRVVTGYFGANYFLYDGLYLRAFGGMAHLGGGKSPSKTGLGFGGGAGYEFFANADLAVGMGADVQLQKFGQEGDFTAFNFNIIFNVY